MKPLRIRAYLQTGVISDQFLPLDSVLYYHKVRDVVGEQIVTKPGESAVREAQHVKLPFDKLGRNDMWYYACSFAQWPDSMVEDSTFYVKKLDVKYIDLVNSGPKKIQQSRGQYKAYHINVFYRHAQYIEWYCIGEKEEIEKLLRFCTHLGKKTVQGWGSVLRWEVTEWPDDWSVNGPGGKLMRAVPVRSGGYLYGIRPSYWNERHIFRCRMP